MTTLEELNETAVKLWRTQIVPRLTAEVTAGGFRFIKADDEHERQSREAIAEIERLLECLKASRRAPGSSN